MANPINADTLTAAVCLAKMEATLQAPRKPRTRKAPTPNGVILYAGPSLLDGAPIVVIATGIKKTSANAKTGNMVQTWIIRSDVNPMIAVKSGEDASVCGDCPHRPALDGSCYVKTFQAPRSIYEAFHRGQLSCAG